MGRRFEKSPGRQAGVAMAAKDCVESGTRSVKGSEVERLSERGGVCGELRESAFTLNP